MASIDVMPAGAAFTANGDTFGPGYITVASNAGFFPGAEAWLSDNAGHNQRVVITDLVSTDKIGVRFVLTDITDSSMLGYGRSVTSTFTLANASRINMPGQCVRVDLAWTKHPIV